MTLEDFRRRPTQLKFPEATARHVDTVLGTETDERVRSENFVATRTDHGGGHVIKPYGEVISPEALWSMREHVLARLAAEGLELGTPLTSASSRNTWDRTVGAALLETIDMEPFQRHGDDAWTYLTVHLFHEFPGWRFPGRQREAADSDEKVKPRDRVLGGRRNVLYRVWFRAHVLGPDLRIPDGADPLGEDELDNIFGRPTISRNHELTRKIVDTVYRNRPKSGNNRLFVVRELLKEIRRRYSTVHFVALGDDLDVELDRLWVLAQTAYNKK